MKRYERIALIAFVLLCAAAFVGAAAMGITDNLWPEGLLIGAGVGITPLRRGTALGEGDRRGRLPVLLRGTPAGGRNPPCRLTATSPL